jgi:hypothetical protein
MKKVNFKITSMLLVLLLGSCAWWQANFGKLDCAALVTIQDAPQLVTIVTECAAIAVNSAAILPCVEAAAASKWPSDVLQCFVAAQAMSAKGKATGCPAFDTAKAGMK